MKKLKELIKEEQNKKQSINQSDTGIRLPAGFFMIDKLFSIGFGSWAVKFHPGYILQITPDQKVLQYLPRKDKWQERYHSFTKRKDLVLSRYGDWGQQNIQLRKFLKNTTPISEKEVKQMIKNLKKENKADRCQIDIKKLQSNKGKFTQKQYDTAIWFINQTDNNLCIINKDANFLTVSMEVKSLLLLKIPIELIVK